MNVGQDADQVDGRVRDKVELVWAFHKGLGMVRDVIWFVKQVKSASLGQGETD